MSYSPEQILAMLDAAIKGITTTSTLGASILEPAQFNRFVRQLQHRTVVLPRYRLQIMDNPIVDIDRIAFSSRVMGVPPSQGAAKDSADFVSPSFAQHKLTAARMQGVVSITDQLLRNNPERAALSQTILDMIAERAGLDIEEQAINGDTGNGSDAFLALNDGWLVQTRRRACEDANKAYDELSDGSLVTAVGQTTATVYFDQLPIAGKTFQVWEVETDVSHGTLVADEDGDGVLDEVAASGVAGTIDYESGTVTLTGLTAETEYAFKYTANAFDQTDDTFPENMFDNMITVIPKAYFRNPGEWDLNVPWWVLKAYRNRLKARNSPLGDQAQTGMGGSIRIPYEDLWIQYVPNMPNNKAWLTHPNNTIYGVFAQVELEQEREAKAKRNDIIVDTETDYGFEEPEASVVADFSAPTAL